jgi:hypothetical protein
MIKTSRCNYRRKSGAELKKAVFISLSEPVSKLNISEYSNTLYHQIEKKFDTYILILNHPDKINASTIKLIMMFRNSCRRTVGLLMKNNITELRQIPELNKLFIIGDSKKSVLKKIVAA